MGNVINAAPNEVAIISGPMGSKKVVGKCDYALWFCNRVDRLELKLLTLEVRSIQAETCAGVRLNVVGVCQLKVDAFLVDDQGRATSQINDSMIDKACQHFLGKGDHEVRESLLRTMEGHQRGILGSLTVEEIYKDRETFARRTKDAVEDDLKGLGFKLVSYTIQDIGDSCGYMESLGATKVAETKRLAAEGRARNEAEARKTEAIEHAEARRVEIEQECLKNIAINVQKQQEAKSNQELSLKREMYKIEVNKAKAQTQANLMIEQAIQKQHVIRAQTQQLVEESKTYLDVTKNEAGRQKKEAEGVALGDLIIQKNKAAALEAKAQAAASQIRLKGEADGQATLAKGKAEAEALRKKAVAYNEFGNAFIIQSIAEALPAITYEVGNNAYSEVSEMKFLSNDQASGTMSADLSRVFSTLPITVKDLTGVDINKGLSRLVEGSKGKESIGNGISIGDSNKGEPN